MLTGALHLHINNHYPDIIQFIRYNLQTITIGINRLEVICKIRSNESVVMNALLLLTVTIREGIFTFM